MKSPLLIYTLGHSTHPWPEFTALLQSHHIQTLADVRRYPGSRKYPHFNQASLQTELPKINIAYAHFPSLGGRRTPLPDSINTAWRNASFRGYADYMQTAPFLDALHQLESLATQSLTAIMCAEAVPWRCHRSLIADALLIRHWQVKDIMTPSAAKSHALTPFAKVEGAHLTYPASQTTIPFPSHPNPSP